MCDIPCVAPIDKEIIGTLLFVNFHLEDKDDVQKYVQRRASHSQKSAAAPCKSHGRCSNKRNNEVNVSRKSKYLHSSTIRNN